VVQLGRRFTIGGEGVSLSIFDRAAMAIGELAYSGPSIILIPPDPFVPTCVYVELAAHVAYMSAQEDNRSGLLVAVVSPGTILRTFHRRVQLGRLAKIETIVPTEVVSEGRIWRYGSSEVHGATIFLEDVNDLERVGPVDLVVVDAPVARMARAVEFAKYVVFVVRDPADRGVIELARSTPAFGFSPSDVAAVPANDRMINIAPFDKFARARLDNIARQVGINVIPVRVTSVAAAAAEIWRMLPEIMRSVSSGSGRDLLRLSFVRYQQLTHLLAPTREFSLLYGSPEAIISGIESAARMIRGEEGELHIPFLALALRDLLGALGTVSPKASAAEDLVRALSAESGPASVRIAVLNAPMAALTDAWFASRGLAVEVVPLSALRRLDPSTHLILSGMPPAWARHILSSGIAKAIHLLAYVGDARDAADEGQIAARTAELAARNREWLARPAARERSWGELTAEPVEVVDDQPNPPSIGSVLLDLPEESARLSLWNGLLDSGFSQRVPVAADGHATPDAEAFVITFSDGRWLLLGGDSLVARVRGGRVEQGVALSAVAPGDTLMVIDRDPRKALLDKVLEQAATVPQYAVVSEGVRVWRDALRAGYIAAGTYASLNSLFRAAGVDVEDQTVGTWVRGVTIGPSDREHVRQVGIALGNSVLTQKHQLVCDAISKLRGIHVKLGVRLGSMALAHGSKALAGARDEDELLDELSGLTLGDFKRSLEFPKIRSIDRFGIVPVQMLGTIREADEHLEKE
jgi:hypothetical protein